MLNNTRIFESAENKELDKLLKAYNDLQPKYKDMEKTLKCISDRIKEICQKQAGTFETPNNVFSLDESFKKSINVELLKEKHAEVFNDIPVKYFSIKVGDIQKDKELWAEIPIEVITQTRILSMGTIRPKA